MGRSRSSSGSSKSSSGSLFGKRPSSPSRSSSTAAPSTAAPSRPVAPATSSPSYPTASASPIAQPQSSGLMGSIGSTIMQGMAFGTGSAIANRAVDAVVGPRTVVHEHSNNAQAAAAPSAAPSRCMDESTNFNTCMRDNGNNASSCSFYYDSLSQCQKMV